MFFQVGGANTECIGDVIILFTMLLADKPQSLRLIVPKIEQYASYSLLNPYGRAFVHWLSRHSGYICHCVVSVCRNNSVTALAADSPEITTAMGFSHTSTVDT